MARIGRRHAPVRVKPARPETATSAGTRCRAAAGAGAGGAGATGPGTRVSPVPGPIELWSQRLGATGRTRHRWATHP